MLGKYDIITNKWGVNYVKKNSKRYTPEFKKLVIETMQEEKLSYSETCRRLSEFGESDADYIDIYHETYSFIIGALYRLASSENKAQNCIFETGLEVEPGRNSRVTYETSLRYIATMVYDRVTVADIAEKVHTSVRNLEYLFKRYMNMTVKDYMISVKISSAAALLRMNAKVSETADKLCFEDVSTFTRLFKKHMGVTPKQYQQQCNSDENVFGTVYRETIPLKKNEEKE